MNTRNMMHEFKLQQSKVQQIIAKDASTFEKSPRVGESFKLLLRASADNQSGKESKNSSLEISGLQPKHETTHS